MRIKSLLTAGLISLPAVGSIAISRVPERMLLTASMRAAELSKGLLVALDFNNGGEDKIVNEGDIAKVDDVIRSHTKTYGSVCYVVRRPG